MAMLPLAAPAAVVKKWALSGAQEYTSLPGPPANRTCWSVPSAFINTVVSKEVGVPVVSWKTMLAPFGDHSGDWTYSPVRCVSWCGVPPVAGTE